jgi:UDP-N-acetylglucosamine--N-acetylmuramyl-(pentapeptide) pyrophosphoryl-undecaprenol N-acetylglucosamine transferase
MKNNVTVVFAGAGTAGHVEPALAVASWIRDHSPAATLIFLGTREGVESRLVPQAGFKLLYVEKTPFPRKISTDLLTWSWRFFKTLRQVSGHLRGADAVVGFGGYVAAPAYLIARLKRIPSFAHEANAKPGLANTLAKVSGAHLLYAFGDSSHEAIGIPLRKEIVNLTRQSGEERKTFKRTARSSLGLEKDLPTVLIFGGSLGSAKFNEVVGEALPAILNSGVQVIHSVGSNNQLPQSCPGYLPLSYIDDMATCYGAADLIISRSGAVTVAEVGVLGIYTLFIPLAIGNGEQRINAEVVSSRGGGEILPNSEFTSLWLKSHLSDLLRRAEGWNQRIDLPLTAAEIIGEKVLKELSRE